MHDLENLTEVFNNYHDYMEDEQGVREGIRTAVREMEQTVREMATLLQSIHQQCDSTSISDVCKKAREFFPTAIAQYQGLAEKVPKDQYYRFNDHWRFLNQRWSFVSCLLIYLEEEKLAPYDSVAAMIGVQTDRTEGFLLDLEDYLMGLLLMASELSRFAVNSVTAGDFVRPFRVSRFLGELDSGFRLLNLKNDALRRRFDALKYDLKKVEEVVYDLSIRGLRQNPPSEE